MSLICLCLMTAFAINGEAALRRPLPLVSPVLRTYDPNVISTGDVVFRRGRSVVSQIVIAAEKLPFSHVGIAVVDDHGVRIVHATPDGPPPGMVVIDQIEGFLGVDVASAAAVYRTTDVAKAQAASAAAIGYANQRVPFDSAFDLRTADRLYCTELVWRAYQSVGMDVTGGATDDLSIPLGHGPYLLPSTLLKGQLLRLVTEFPIQRTP